MDFMSSCTAMAQTPKSVSEEEETEATQKGLSQLVRTYLQAYFEAHQNVHPRHLHQSVMGEVEKGLLQETLSFTQGNCQETSKILGIHRNTLREKLKKYDLTPR
jgi:Fis family transcriptional regulator